MEQSEKISKINQVLDEYFKTHSQRILAKDLMPEFIKAGIFSEDRKNGLPIRNILRELDKNNELDKIPYVFPDRKKKNTNWYFQPKTKK
ncbi:MAG: hypothetical protein IKJ98_07355 [Bacteroidales bacterium]|nr:hypothetical protein [Bacteroidales bacterium]